MPACSRSCCTSHPKYIYIYKVLLIELNLPTLYHTPCMFMSLLRVEYSYFSLDFNLNSVRQSSLLANCSVITEGNRSIFEIIMIIWRYFICIIVLKIFSMYITHFLFVFFTFLYRLRFIHWLLQIYIYIDLSTYATLGIIHKFVIK